MADLKISQLTSASTPLAGTEVLPIVQSGSTVKVSVANLTAGRAVGMAGGSFTDNITQGTAAKGVNFTANTPAAGMTSQLLNWYEEGTFTPSLVPGTSGSITLTVAAAKYTRIGRAVTVTGICEVSSVSSPVGTLLLQGLPYTNSSAASSRSAAAIYATGLAVTATTAITGRIIPSESQIRIEKFAAGSTSAMAGDVQTNTIIQFNLTYFV